jgi:hypothetical protein
MKKSVHDGDPDETAKSCSALEERVLFLLLEGY